MSDIVPYNPAKKQVFTVGLIDKSGSMSNDDYKKKDGTYLMRLEAALVWWQHVAGKMRFGDDYRWIGLALFDHSCDPLTGLISPDELLSCWDELTSGVPPSGGTSFLNALSTARRMLAEFPNERRTIMLLTDGEDFDPSLLALAHEIKSDDRIQIETVGVGDKDEVNESLLKQIASVNENGEPRYKFAEDPEELEQQGNAFAALPWNENDPYALGEG